MDPLGQFGAWFDRLPAECRRSLAFAVLALLADAPPETQLAGVPEARFAAWLRAPLAGNLQLIGRCLTLRAAVDFAYDRGMIRAVHGQDDLGGQRSEPTSPARLQIVGQSVRAMPFVGLTENVDEQQFLTGEAWVDFKEQHFSNSLLDAFYNCEAEPKARVL